MDEVEIVVSDKYVSRGGFGAAKRGLKDVEDQANKTSKSLADAGSEGGGSFASNFGKGLGGVKDAFTANMAELGPAALALAAPAGAIAAGGIVAGFGAGIAGMGLAFANESSAVKHEIDDLKADLTAGMVEAAAPLRKTWFQISDDAREAFARIKPELAHAFDDLSPSISRFSDNAFNGFSKLGTAIGPMEKAFSAILDDIGPRLPDLFNDISDSLSDLADSVSENPRALGDMIDGLGNVVSAGTKMVGWANDAWAAMRPLMSMGQSFSQDALADGLEAVAEKTQKLGDSADRTTPGMRAVASALGEIADEASSAEDKASALSVLIDQITGQTPDYTDALKSGSDALRDVNDKLFEGTARAQGFGDSLLNQSGAFDVTKENAGKLYDQVRDVTGAMDSMASSVANGQGSREQFIADANGMRDGLNETWRAAGLTEDQIAHLNQVYGLTPDMIATRVALLGADSAEAQLNYMARTRYASVYVTTLGGGSVNGQTTFHDLYAHGGVTSTAATGGNRGGNVTMNERGGEQVRLPNGSRVLTAEASRAFEKNMFAAGTNGGGGGGDGWHGTLSLPTGGSAMQRLLVQAVTEALRSTGIKVKGLTS